MSIIRGQPVGCGWADWSPESKARILSQLKDYTSQIRTLSPPHDGSCGGVQGNNLFGPHIHAAFEGFGPFKSTADFHAAARDGYGEGPNHPDVSQLIELQQKWEKSVFSHSDLRNIKLKLFIN
jgi:hypothetical protein